MSKITEKREIKKKLNKVQLIAAIIEWMYLNDGGFSSKNEWRRQFIMHLKGLIYSKK